MRKVLLACSALVILATSCKKDKDDEPVTPTKENLVGSYKITKVIAVTNGQTSELTNNDAWSDPCERDDIHKLNADNTYQWVDAGTKCDPPGDYNSDWAFINNSSVEVDGYTYTIKSFNGRTLELSENWMGSEVVTTFTKQ